MSKRTQQVGDEIQRILSDVIQNEIKDPRVGFATVTRVEVSSDLSHAWVHVSVLGDNEQQRETMQALERARGFLRRSVAQELRHMRTVPDLHLKQDSSLQYSARIDEVLRHVSEDEQASDAGPAETDKA